MNKLADVRANLACKALVRDADQLPKGHIRIETTFKYPDGGSIELFVVEGRSTPPSAPNVLSDLGQTTAWLLNLQIKPWLSKERQALINDVLEVYGVRQEGGAFEIDVASLDELEPKIVTLAQACLRIADLTFTHHASLQALLSEDMDEEQDDHAPVRGPAWLEAVRSAPSGRKLLGFLSRRLAQPYAEGPPLDDRNGEGAEEVFEAIAREDAAFRLRLEDTIVGYFKSADADPERADAQPVIRGMLEMVSRLALTGTFTPLRAWLSAPDNRWAQEARQALRRRGLEAELPLQSNTPTQTKPPRRVPPKLTAAPGLADQWVVH